MSNGNMMPRMVVQQNTQFEPNFVNGTQNGGPPPNRPQNPNVPDQQQGSYHNIPNGYIVQNVSHQPRPAGFHHAQMAQNVQGGHGQVVSAFRSGGIHALFQFYYRQEHMMSGPGGHQIVAQPGPMNGNHMNGNVRPAGHVPQPMPPNPMQVSFDVWKRV